LNINVLALIETVLFDQNQPFFSRHDRTSLDLLNASFIISSDGFFVLFTLIKVDQLGTTILTKSLQQKLMGDVFVSSFSE
jgi:hypothetical protein